MEGGEVSECVKCGRPANGWRIIRRGDDGSESVLCFVCGYREGPKPRPVVLPSDFRFDSRYLAGSGRKS